MTKHQSDPQIDDLIATMKPKKTLPPYERRFLVWLAIASALLIGIMVLTGIRGDIAMQLQNPLFYIDLGLKFLLTVIAGYCAFRLSVPGLEKKSINRLFLIPLMGWLLFLGIKMGVSYQKMGASIFLMDYYFFCGINLVFLTIIPAFLIILMLKKAAPINRYMCGFLALMAASGLGFMGDKVLCPIETIAHITMWHFSPFFLMSLCGFLVGRYWLKW